VKIGGEIPRAVTFVYRINIYFEQLARFNGIGRSRRGSSCPGIHWRWTARGCRDEKCGKSAEWKSRQ
jgi:hypothetical protein